MRRDMIFDIGMNDGSDTAFYLACGFRVVGVEASEELCGRAAERFADQVASGQLIISNVAVNRVAGPVTFYPNDKHVWGTIVEEWAVRGAALSHQAGSPVTVPGVTMHDLLEEHGHPYYVKIDIEGADIFALEGLHSDGVAPAYLSLESDKTSWEALEHEFDLMRDLGYRRFKIVPQQHVGRQRAQVPIATGQSRAWKFRLGDSGNFGDAAPGRWVDADDALQRYRRIFARYRLFGDDGTFTPPGKVGAAVRRYLAGWYDTHAAL